MKLVLLPGLDGTGVLFRPLLAALPASLTPVVIAYPGHEPLGYDELVPYVRARLPNEPFVMLGESFGGPLSLRIASDQSLDVASRLRGLILAGSFVTCPYSFVPTWADRFVPPLPQRVLTLQAQMKAWLGLYEKREDHALSIEALSSVAAGVFAHRMREIVRVNVEEQLLACRAPMLYLQGTRDRVVWSSNWRRIQRLRPDVRCVRIDAGHMILKTQPRAAARAIAEFIGSVHTP